MSFGRQTRLLDERIRDFSGTNADLIEASPLYATWRAKILTKGVPSKIGYKLELGDGLYAALSGRAGGTQPIAFGAIEVPPTRLLLQHAQRSGNKSAFSVEIDEHWWLHYWDRDDFPRVEAMVKAITPLDLRIFDGDHLVVTNTLLTDVALRLRRVGAGFHATFAPDGTPLDVLLSEKGDAYSLYNRLVLVSHIPVEDAQKKEYLRQLSFLPAPAARELIARLERGDVDDQFGRELTAAGRASSTDDRVTCGVCGQDFWPAWPDSERHSRDNYWRICARCHESLRSQAGEDRGPTAELDALSQLAHQLGHVPTVQWRSELQYVEDFERYLHLWQIGLRVRAPSWYARIYGSWFESLIAAGVVSDAQRMVFGTRVLASDGHLCSSLGEKQIDDWLYRLGVMHEREPKYPGTAMRADFLVNGRFVEYFGLAGLPEYDAKSSAKRDLAHRLGLTLVAITGRDLAQWSAHELRIAHELGIDEGRLSGSPHSRV